MTLPAAAVEAGRVTVVAAGPRLELVAAAPRLSAPQGLAARRAAASLKLGGVSMQGERVGIMFGPERTGLENDDMVHADTALSIRKRMRHCIWV